MLRRPRSTCSLPLGGALAMAALLVAGGLALGAAAHEAQAQQPAGSSLERAKQLAARGNAQYQVGRFEDALRHYEEAYQVHAVPALIFNIAQCYRQLGRYERAVFLYRSFLRAVPAAPNRAQVEEIIGELDKLIAGQRKAGTAPPESNLGLESRGVLPGPAATSAGLGTASDGAEGRAWYRRWYVWAIVGVVVAGAVTGGAVAGARSGSPMGPPQGSIGTMGFTFGGGSR